MRQLHCAAFYRENRRAKTRQALQRWVEKKKENRLGRVEKWGENGVRTILDDGNGCFVVGLVWPL